MYLTWGFWLFLVVINCMIFFNFMITIVTEVYETRSPNVQIEESYKKKAEILRDLDAVFGDRIDFLPVNILVFREKKINSNR